MKRKKTLFPALVLLFCMLLTACGSSGGGTDSGSGNDNKAGSRGSTLEVLECSADGTATEVSDAATIDYSNAAEGYIMVKYTGSNAKVKLQITTPDGSTYTFSLNGTDYDSFPLTGGSGTYHVAVYENISGDQYSTALSADIATDITNEYGPYLYPNQYVDYSNATNTIKESEELAKSADSDIDVVSNVYEYMIQNFTYDYDKADSVQSGYTPDVDASFASKTGICFDYAAVMATMLRVQKIPTRLEVGYVGEVYHAWISVYIEDVGWVNGLIEFDGQDWEMLDPTFASTSDDPEKFVPEDSDYIVKYVY